MYCALCGHDIDESQFTYYQRTKPDPKCMKCLTPRHPIATCRVCGVTLSTSAFPQYELQNGQYHCKYCLKHKLQWDWIEHDL